jgi:hypothetical protein
MKQQTITFLFILISAVSAVDYCALCRDHIACNNNGRFSPACPSNAAIVRLSSGNIQTALSAHNQVRDKIASGSQGGFRPASKMMTLVRNFSLIKLFINLNKYLSRNGTMNWLTLPN